MDEAENEGAEGGPVQPLFDAEGLQKLVLALSRAAASSIASGIALSTGRPQDVRALLRIQKEVFNAFISLAFRDPSLPPISAFAGDEPLTKVLSAINRFSAAAITAGVVGSSGRAHSVGDAMRSYYATLTLMWPSAEIPPPVQGSTVSVEAGKPRPG